MIQRISFLLFTLFLFSCQPQIKEKVEETHPDNKPKLINYYQEVNGNDELIEQKEFHLNGQLKMSGKFVNEKRDGKWMAYFDNGKPQSQGIFIDGKRTGSAKVYFANGKLRYEGEYKDDKEFGHWKFYNEKGELIKEKDFNE